MIRLKSWRLIGWSSVVILLTAPLVAMQFENGVNWTLSDFVIAAVLLVGTGLLIEFSLRISSDLAYRAGMVMAILTCLLLIWINLAVGIIGSEDNPANAMYLVVLAIFPIGGLFARLQAAGLRWVMIATAASQLVVGGLALWLNFTDNVAPVLFLNTAFSILWLISAGLFHNATEPHNRKLNNH